MMEGGSSGKVLIVDNDPANVDLVSRMIGRLGYTIATAADGRGALSAVKRELPDVVLLDVDMPLVDGFEVCRRLKSDPATRLIPVVLLTALTAGPDQ